MDQNFERRMIELVYSFSLFQLSLMWFCMSARIFLYDWGDECETSVFDQVFLQKIFWFESHFGSGFEHRIIVKLVYL